MVNNETHMTPADFLLPKLLLNIRKSLYMKQNLYKTEKSSIKINKSHLYKHFAFGQSHLTIGFRNVFCVLCKCEN